VRKPNELICDRCGGRMVKGRRAKSGGCVLFVIGFLLLFLFPIGTIIGIILIIGSFAMGNEYYWICKNCKIKIPRGTDWWELW